MAGDEGTADWPYRHIADRLREGIAAGRIGPKLPTIDAMAAEYGVTSKTVQAAITVLKDEGLVYGKRGLGLFVK